MSQSTQLRNGPSSSKDCSTSGIGTGSESSLQSASENQSPSWGEGGLAMVSVRES